MSAVHDRVKETSTTEGTGSLTLAGAVSQFVAFSSRYGIGSGYTFPYVIVGQSGTEWEVGNGYLSDATTLVRSPTASSNSDALVDLSAGTKDVFVSLTAAYVDALQSEGLASESQFFLDTTSSLADNYTLSASPSSYAEVANVKAVTSATSPVFFERFVSSPLTRSSIPAGTWTFSIYAATSSTVGDNRVKFRVNKRVAQTGITGTFTGAGATRTFTTTGGSPFVVGDANASRLLAGLIETETQTAWISGYTSSSEVTVTLTDAAFVNTSGVNLNAIYYYLFDTQTADMSSTSATLYTVTSTQSEFSGLNDTDRLVLALFGSTDQAGSRNHTLYYGGTANYTHFQVPLSLLHNDLAGLNSGDYRHLTAAEYATVTARIPGSDLYLWANYR